LEEGGELLRTGVIPGRTFFSARVARVIATAWLCLSFSHALDAVAAPPLQLSDARYALNVPREGLSAALKRFALETGLQVARLSDDESDDPEVGPLVGNYTAIQALDTLLRGTRFDYRVVDTRTIAIVRRAPAESPTAAAGTRGPARSPQRS